MRFGAPEVRIRSHVLSEEAVEGGYVTAEDFDAIVRPEDMIGPK